MMFGAHNSDEWCTDDDDDDDDEDEDDDDEEYDEEYYDSEADDADPDHDHIPNIEQSRANVPVQGEALWEPQAKNYSHMNLKETASKERQAAVENEEDDDDDEDDAEVPNEDAEAAARRKLKNAKKRAEKRRKQKEKKLKEAAEKAAEESEQKRLEELKLQKAVEEEQRRVAEMRFVVPKIDVANSLQSSPIWASYTTLTAIRLEFRLRWLKLMLMFNLYFLPLFSAFVVLACLVISQLQDVREKQHSFFLDAVRAGSLDDVRRYVETGQDPSTLSRKAPFSAWLEANYVREVLPTMPLLQLCSTKMAVTPTAAASPAESASVEAESTGAGEASGGGAVYKRFAVAQYLLSLSSPLVGLRVVDEEGRMPLHVAVRNGDVPLLKLLLAVKDDRRPERRADFDLNARCTKQGYTALHYAVQQADLPIIRLLMEAGIQLSLNAGLNGKGPTPLEMVKNKLQNGSQLNSSQTSLLQSIAREISEAIRQIERLRLQKEAERFEKEAKLEEEKRKQQEKDAKERELLERKQRQLKEKQERDKKREEEEAKRKSGPISSSSSSGASSSKNASTSTSKSVAVASAATSANAAAAAPSSSGSKSVSTSTSGHIANSDVESSSIQQTPDASGSAKKKKKKKGGQGGADDADATGAGQANTDGGDTVGGAVTASDSVAALAAADVRSRDELVDHLLNMGFPESACLAAINMFGTDMDRFELYCTT